MQAVLIVPDSKARGVLGAVRRSTLSWTADHSASSYGLGVMLYDNGGILDGFNFRELRDNFGAVIETDDRKKVCGALGVPDGEPGVVQIGDPKEQKNVYDWCLRWLRR